MKDFLKKALSTLVVLDEKKEPEVIRPANSAPATARPHFRTVAVEASVAEAPGTIRISQEVVEKFEAYFMELFQKMDMPGPDYYEFWQACEALEDAVPDVAARMKAAFKMLQKQGLQKDILLQTANDYINGITTDGVRYRQAVDATRATELGGKKAELDATQHSIQGDLEKIAALEKGIESRRARIDALTDEIAASERRIENNSAGYEAACKAMIAKINEDIASIRTII